ncbi:hypothetical protein [Aurantibacillus circumpalustris]|uniref:hypothetical protein n=1 Tax=Aurantibacillus circumpalustris TaxID=3036359 RepID=UPI00295C0730|nr:hypothetical protein [Aurantibacillus circumpalustris]
MKQTLLAVVAVMALSSCAKTRTCTCKDSDGNVVSSTSKKSNSSAQIKAFEDQCKKSSTTTNTYGTSGSSSTSIPCELS